MLAEIMLSSNIWFHRGHLVSWVITFLWLGFVRIHTDQHTHLSPTLHGSLTLTVLVVTTDAQWEGMGDVGSARYEPALLPPCPTIRVLSYSN